LASTVMAMQMNTRMYLKTLRLAHGWPPSEGC
jgi:hypothetical protein